MVDGLLIAAAVLLAIIVFAIAYVVVATFLR
jgi:hypothetical protein